MTPIFTASSDQTRHTAPIRAVMATVLYKFAQSSYVLLNEPPYFLNNTLDRNNSGHPSSFQFRIHTKMHQIPFFSKILYYGIPIPLKEGVSAKQLLPTTLLSISKHI